MGAADLAELSSLSVKDFAWNKGNELKTVKVESSGQEKEEVGGSVIMMCH